MPDTKPAATAISTPKRIWIDLDNSPHVPFFAPIIEELERRGCTVEVTARNAYQVLELADLLRLTYTPIGRHYGKHKVLKVLGTCLRALQLSNVVVKRRPRLAVSHGSRSQLLVSTLLGIPLMCLFDYEFSSSLRLIKPTWMVAPNVLADSADWRGRKNVLKYPGIKEDVYAPRFRPDPSIKKSLGIADARVVATVRPPASEAHYHNPESDTLFKVTMEKLADNPDVRIVLLPRNSRQADSLRDSWADLFATGKASIPSRAVDGLNLIWHSDLVISGGGTMNREAAALAVPVYSIFRGTIGAVDHFLAKTGRLTLLESPEDVRTKLVLAQRDRSSQHKGSSSETLDKIVDHIIAAAEGRLRGTRPGDIRGAGDVASSSVSSVSDDAKR